MVKGSRNYHGKSKNGCRQCKKRRVKCDCIGPICSNCRRRQEHCSYLGLLAETLNAEIADTNSAEEESGIAIIRRAAAVATHACSKDALGATLPAEQLKADEAELKHHFHTQAWFTLSLRTDPRNCDVWSRWIPQLASRHIFIQQSMLAVAAFHLYHLRPPDRQRYYAMACRYAIQGSNYFRLAVKTVTAENWLLTCTFSICHGIFNLYRTVADDSLTGEPVEFEPAKSFSLMRVAGKLCDSITPFIPNGPLRQKLIEVEGLDLDIVEYPLLRPALAKLGKLEEFLASRPTETELQKGESQLYLSVLYMLREWVSGLTGRPKSWKQFIAFPAAVPDEFVTYLEEARPTALVIIILWFEVMTLAPERWYLTQWTERELRGVTAILQREPRSLVCRYWEAISSVQNTGEPTETAVEAREFYTETQQLAIRERPKEGAGSTN